MNSAYLNKNAFISALLCQWENNIISIDIIAITQSDTYKYPLQHSKWKIRFDFRIFANK